MKLHLETYTLNKQDELLEFIETHPWPEKRSRNSLLRFFNELTSNENLIFDVHGNDQRVGAGVLLDKINNPSNNACLEVLAISVPLENILELLLTSTKKRLPQTRSGFEIGLPAGFALPSHHFLEKHYEMYDMQNSAPHRHSKKGEFALAFRSEDAELFQVLKSAFQNNIDTSIPSFEDWQKGRSRNQNRKTWIIRDAGKIVAFLDLLFTDAEAEISTVGVLSEFRGKGYARSLIAHALSEFPTKSFKLSVAVQNSKALGLYESLGFSKTASQYVYQWARNEPTH